MIKKRRRRNVKLFVDDLRLPPDGWELARTITEAIRKIVNMEFEEVSLDHDIMSSAETFEPVARFIACHNIRRPNGKKMKVRIHTGNWVGGEKMARILDISWKPSFYPQDYRSDPEVPEDWEEPVV